MKFTCDCSIEKLVAIVFPTYASHFINKIMKEELIICFEKKKNEELIEKRF